MTRIGVTQRQLPPTEHGDRLDALDPRWPVFLGDGGMTSIALPNRPELAVRIASDLDVTGLLFSGGEDLAGYGGPSPIRDATEAALLEWALRHDRPVVGACRGMQVLLDFYGSLLEPVDGHVAVRHEAMIGGTARVINCYHRWAARRVRPPLTRTGYRADVVESIEHTDARVHGIMWHPERRAADDPERVHDLRQIRRWLLGGTP